MGEQGLLLLALQSRQCFLQTMSGRGQAEDDQSPVKLVLLVRAFFCGTAQYRSERFLSASQLFEVFHDVQYLSLVWIYNRKRVESDSSIGGLCVYIPAEWRAVGVYVWLSARLRWAESVESYVGIEGLTYSHRSGDRVCTAPFLLRRLHLEVREKSTRNLLASASAADFKKGFCPSWALHGAKEESEMSHC